MKSRIAILGMLVAGLVFSTAGAGLALQGQSGKNAAISQYGTPTPTPTPTPVETVAPAEGEGGVLPGEAESGGGGGGPAETENAPTGNGGGVLPAEQSDTQPARQEAAPAEGSELPFTGFAAVPILLGGLALLTGGLILRSRTRSE